jgi:hypothetical protein
LIGRSRVIRTLDPLLPKQVRYQAALYSVRIVIKGLQSGSSGAVTMSGVIAARLLLFKRFHKLFFKRRHRVAKQSQTV